MTDDTEIMHHTAPIPVVSVEVEHNDWLAAAEAIEPYYNNPEQYDDATWAEFLQGQLRLALWYIAERLNATAAPDLATVARRAAVILNAEPDADECERWLGIRISPEFEGQEVKCRNSSCRRKWTCQPEDPYYDAVGNRATGICVSCMLAETRTDAAVPEIEGTIVTPAAVKPPRPRTPRKAVTSSG